MGTSNQNNRATTWRAAALEFTPTHCKAGSEPLFCYDTEISVVSVITAYPRQHKLISILNVGLVKTK